MRWALLLAGSGGIACIAHLAFLAIGRPEFRDPLSLALLALIGVVSLLQVAHEWRTPRGGDE
jgi:hypothetical protein